jgi:hypothetical protein
MTPYAPQTIAAIHRRLDRALEAELDRLASANPAHQEDRYRAGVALVAGILRQLADEAEGLA